MDNVDDEYNMTALTPQQHVMMQDELSIFTAAMRREDSNGTDQYREESKVKRAANAFVEIRKRANMLA